MRTPAGPSRRGPTFVGALLPSEPQRTVQVVGTGGSTTCTEGCRAADELLRPVGHHRPATELARMTVPRPAGPSGR